MTKSPRVPKPPRTYICRFCQSVFKRSEHLARHERSHTQEKPFGCSVCSCMFSRKDLVVRHERMIHFERKPTTRMTSRKARKYEPRRESQSSEAQESAAISSTTTPSSERRQSLPKTPTLDPAAAKKTAEEALSTAILQGIPNIFDEIANTSTTSLSSPVTPKSGKRRASSDDDDDDDLDSRPTKLRVLDQTLTSPASVAPVAPMFGRGSSNSSGGSSTAISPTKLTTSSSSSTTATTLAAAANALTKPAISVPTSIFPGFDIDPILRDPEFEAQLEDDDETAEDTLRMFTHAEQQLFSPPLSDGDSEKEESGSRNNEEFLREAAAEAWKLQLEEEIKAAA
ncbi:hypothetical protein TWF506_005925 [Arthrobotrys conoides]|uniref:C2H2-type domain-containing protein n=1 Tax=Arthrobotrys conoides TaxID=74498 RepID=A0AAN8NQ41_9PEZI